MRKEVLIAIIIGFGLGLVITFGIWTANKALKENASEMPSPVEEEIEEEPAPKPVLELLVVSPENNIVSEKEIIEVSGQTATGAVVAIVYPDGEEIIETDESGAFSTEISLIGGDNQIEISAFNPDGDEVAKILTVVYSTAEF